MAVPFTVSDLFAAIKAIWLAQGLDQVMTGLYPGIFSFQPPERTPRPYAVLSEAKMSPMLFSNKNRYDDLTFSLELIDTDIDTLAPRQHLVLAALGEHAFTLTTGPNQGKVLTLIPGDTTYYNEMTYLRCVHEFTAKISQSRIY